MENVYGRFGLGPPPPTAARAAAGPRSTRGLPPRRAPLPAPHRPERPDRRMPRSRGMPPLASATPLRSNRRNGELRRTPHPGAPSARLGRAGGGSGRSGVERLQLVARTQGRGAQAQGDHHDLDGTCAALPAHGEPAPGGAVPSGPPWRSRSTTTRPGARSRAGQGGHHLRGARGGRHHPLRGGVPVPERGADRPGPLGPQHRHRDPRAAGQPADRARGRHQPVLANIDASRWSTSTSAPATR